MLAAFVGPMGAGKTCMMTYVLYKDYIEKNRRIQSNYNLFFPQRYNGYTPEKLSLPKLLDATNKQMVNSSIAIDEAWLFFDSRNAQSKKSRMISHILLQSRKRDVDVYVTSQTFKQLDPRFRQNCDYVTLVAMRQDYIFARMFNRDRGKWTKLVINAKPVYSLYDTTEIIDPTAIDEDAPIKEGQDNPRKKALKRKDLPRHLEDYGAEQETEIEAELPKVYANPTDAQSRAGVPAA